MQKKRQAQQKVSASTSFKQTSRSQSSQQEEQIEPTQSTFMNPQSYSINTRLNNILFQIKLMFDQGNPKQPINRLLDLQDKINLLRKTGKMFDLRFQMICHYNLGCAYQAQAFLKTNQQAINQCISHLNEAIQLVSEIVRLEEKASKQGQIRLKVFQAKMLLQCCALLSQVESHEMALQYGKQALSLLNQVLKMAKITCKSELNKIKVEKEKNTGMKGEMLAFSQSLLLACGAQLEELGIIQDFQGIMKTNDKTFEKIKQNSYFWKDNVENNSRTFKKEMKKMNGSGSHSSSSSPFKQGSSAYYSVQPLDSCINQSTIRNSLGLKINNSWISQMNIGKVMRMTPVEYVHFIQPDKVTCQFSSRSLIQKIILICVVYFSIATQMRFLQDEQDKKSSPSIIDQKPEQQTMRKSELFHFKSIQLAYKYIKQDCPLIDHLINSYLRHYHGSLACIQEKPSFVQHSEIFGQVKRSTIVLSRCQLEPDGEYLVPGTGQQNQEDFGNRKTIGCRRDKKISIIDSVELDRGLIKSVQWPKKQFKRAGQSPQGYCQIQKQLKKSDGSTRCKQSTTIKGGMDDKQKQKQKQRIGREKEKRKHSSKKSILKIIKTQR